MSAFLKVCGGFLYCRGLVHLKDLTFLYYMHSGSMLLTMARASQQHFVMVFAFVSVLINYSEPLQTSQGETLLRIQRLLNYPAVLSSWNSSTDFCNVEPSSSVTVVCYSDSISQLQIIGSNGTPLLPGNFSMDSLVTTLGTLPGLKVLTLASLGLWGPLPEKIGRILTLEILNISSNFLYGAIPRGLSSLTNLQTIILDDNMFSGALPDWFGSLTALAVLTLRKNMFNGSFPSSFSNLENLRILALSHNYLFGEVPSLSSLSNLQVLDLEDNGFGPHFPQLGSRLLTLVLTNNKFRNSLPAALSNYYQLQWLDVSNNKFVGPLPMTLFSLPAITYINITNNKFTGMFFENQTCGPELEFVDLSSNLITGHLPRCLQPDSEKTVLYAGNCLATADQDQKPDAFCRNQAFAVGVLPRQLKKKRVENTILALYVTGGVIGGISLAAFMFLLLHRRLHSRKTVKKSPTSLISENASTGYPSKLLSDARYISQTMKLGALGVPAYRTFSLEELEEATNYFDTSAFIGKGSQGQMYKGRLKDGSLVAVRCLKMKSCQSTKKFMHHVELISKLRHRHLVSALGHCFECYFDDSSVSRIFFVFEYVPNGKLRSWVSEGLSRKKPDWAQRIAAAIGVVRGIQFLHTGIVPGIYSNNLKITDVLLDQNLTAKISIFNLPLLVESPRKIGRGGISSGVKGPSTSAASVLEEKSDVYDFGVILLELIVGKPLTSENDVNLLRHQLQASVAGDENARRRLGHTKGCSDQALKTVTEICLRCLQKDAADRPSVEDVLWNLQFAAQVQDGWRGDSHSDEGSSIPSSLSRGVNLAIS